MKDLMQNIMNKICNEIKNDESEGNKSASYFLDTKIAMMPFKDNIISKESYTKDNLFILNFKVSEKAFDENSNKIDVNVLINRDNCDTIISTSNGENEFLQTIIKDIKENNIESWNYSEKINNIMENSSAFIGLSKDEKDNYKNELNHKFFGDIIACLDHEPKEEETINIERKLDDYIEYSKDNLEKYELDNENLEKNNTNDKDSSNDVFDSLDSWE